VLWCSDADAQALARAGGLRELREPSCRASRPFSACGEAWVVVDGAPRRHSVAPAATGGGTMDETRPSLAANGV
jgi:hypothetical protein